MKWISVRKFQAPQQPNKATMNSIARKDEEMLVKKGRSWCVVSSTLKKDNWEFYKEQVEDCIIVINKGKKKLRLCELARLTKTLEEFGRGRILNIKCKEIRTQEDEDYMFGLLYSWNIDDTIEYINKQIKSKQNEQKFWTYMYNEYPIEKVAKYKKRIIDYYVEDMERTFEEKEKSVTYTTIMPDGSEESIKGEQGYINAMNGIKQNKEQIDILFDNYVRGVTEFGRKQRVGK